MDVVRFAQTVADRLAAALAVAARVRRERGEAVPEQEPRMPEDSLPSVDHSVEQDDGGSRGVRRREAPAAQDGVVGDVDHGGLPGGSGVLRDGIRHGGRGLIARPGGM